MNNERQLKPLREYKLTWVDHEGTTMREDVFTADNHFRDEDCLVFHNTGNIVRQYFYPLPAKIEVTPVDEAQIPQ